MTDIFWPFRSLAKFKQIGEDKFIAVCPVHDEKTPSFRGTIRGHRLLLVCHGCHAKTDDIRKALGLRWSDLFTDTARPTVERQRAKSERAEFDEWRHRELLAAILSLRERDAILGLDWRGYETAEGEELGEVLAEALSSVCRDYGALEWRFEQLRVGSREELAAMRANELH